jgi:murein DD-endopeptidase MepM/ murein hydrolase activator NlpD
MRVLIFCILLLSSCASKEYKDIPNPITVDSGSFILLKPEKARVDGYLINKRNKQFLVYGLPYVNEDTLQKLGDYELFILQKDFGESRIEITDQNLVSPMLEDQKRASAEYLKVRKIIKNKTDQFDSNFNFLSPIQSVITSAYGKRRFINNNERSPHKALDLRGAVGREIFAPKTGKVVLAENHFYGGNKVILDHGGGLFTAYSHMSEILVKSEDVVAAGTVIGLVGMTGRVTGPHLHWEVFLNENRINPELLISLEYAQD